MTSANDIPARGEARPDTGALSGVGVSPMVARRGGAGRRTNSSVLSAVAAEARQQILAAALIDHGRGDPVMRIRVGPEYLGVTSPIVNGSALAAELTAEMWEPILERAIHRGEIRSNLDVLAVGQWLTLVQFIVVGRGDVTGADDPGTREMLKAFVPPAFMPEVRSGAADA